MVGLHDPIVRTAFNLGNCCLMLRAGIGNEHVLHLVRGRPAGETGCVTKSSKPLPVQIFFHKTHLDWKHLCCVKQHVFAMHRSSAGQAAPTPGSAPAGATPAGGGGMGLGGAAFPVSDSPSCSSSRHQGCASFCVCGSHVRAMRGHEAWGCIGMGESTPGCILNPCHEALLCQTLGPHSRYIEMHGFCPEHSVAAVHAGHDDP